MELSQKEMEIMPNTIADLKVDATFRKVPRHAISFAIWKIDEDRLEAVPRTQFGIFVDSCAYIIYAATTVDHFVNQDTITREQKPNVSLARFIHFWLGASVTEQNRANVVHKVHELDAYLGHVAAIYRESQHHESMRFLSYFKKGYDVRASALLKMPEKPRLYQLYGRKWLRCIELPEIAWSHFNSDCIMVLKTETQVYVWIGRSTASIERRSAIEWATKQQHSVDLSLIIVDDGYEQALPEVHKCNWNALLPLNKRAVSQTAMPQTDDEQTNFKFRIYKCNHRGRLHLDQLDVATPSKEDLNDSNAVFLLDNCGIGVWLWVGSQVTATECQQAMGNGRAFAKKKKYANSTLVIRVVEGHEPIEFKRLFSNWLNEWQDNSRNHKPVSTKFGKLDAISLCERPKMAAETQLIDDGSGERTIHRITSEQVVELPTPKVTVFTKNNCYVIKYSVVCATPNPADLDNVGIKTIIYQWNGSDASPAAIAKAEQFATKCYESLTEKGIFVQLNEFDETPHFLQIFEGKLIILQGNKISLLNHNNNLEYTFSNLMLESFLLKIIGDASYNSKAVEVYPLNAVSSKDCFVIKTNHIWVWCGQSSTGDAREMAKSIGSLFGESSLVLEGKESKDFWPSVATYFDQSLIINGLKLSSSSSSSSTSSKLSCNSNGNGNISPTLIYNSSCYLNTMAVTKKRPPTQLFLVWWKKATFYKREIYGYEQNDLHSDCVYVLDAGLLTYVWLGEYAARDVKEQYLKVGQKYLETLPLDRHSASALAIVLQHDEPNVFKGFFNTWNADLWKNFVSFESQRQCFGHTGTVSNGCNGNDKSGELSPLPASLLNFQMDFDRHHKYPINLLQAEIDSLPPEINPLKRELHLTHDDFVSIFKMPFWDFEELPSWKKQELKKKYKLF